MERATPLRNPHASTSELLVWPELPPTASPLTPASAPRSHQPSDRINKLLFGGQVTEEEAASLVNRKPCSGYKKREMTGNGIFAPAPEEGESHSGNPNPNNSRRLYQQTLNGVSQISFGGEVSVSPRKATSLTEVAKQRELTGTLENEMEMRVGKQTSDAKSRELSGHDIFGPPPEIMPRSSAASRFSEQRERPDFTEPAPRTVRTSVKVSNPSGGQSSIHFSEEETDKSNKRRTPRKVNSQRVSDLVGNNIFKEEEAPSPSIPSEKMMSRAKLMEMSGSDIFADGKADSKEHFRGVRQPPGGDSTITLL